MGFKEDYHDAREAGSTRPLSPTFIEWKEEEQQIIGQLKAIAVVQSGLESGEYNQYIVDTDEGLVKFHMGAATDKELKGILNFGGVYAFTYKGQEKISGGRMVNKFVVEAFGEGIEAQEPVDKE